MKLVVLAGVLSMAVAGCSWNDFWSQFDQHNRGGGHGSQVNRTPPGPAINGPVRLFEGAIEHSPAPAVSLVSYAQGDLQEQGVRADLGEGQAVTLSAADPQGIEAALGDGTLSVLDLFLIARAIKAAGFRLAPATTDGNVPGRTGDQVARAVHDLLLGIVHAHTADCKAMCEGDATACEGRRSFGDGAPCAIAGQTQDKIAAHFGPGWCASSFCPALSQVRE